MAGLDPPVFHRGTSAEYAGRNLLDDALDRARDVLATHVPTPMPEEVRREARAVLERHGHTD